MAMGFTSRLCLLASGLLEGCSVMQINTVNVEGLQRTGDLVLP